MEPLIALKGISRRYVSGEQVTTVLDGVDLEIFPGESVAIVGASGSGKSTLMNIMGCLDTASSGTSHFAGRDVASMDEGARAKLRREHFGFIFQRYQLLADLDALSNVEMPAVYNGTPRGVRRKAAASILGQLGLADRLQHRPSELSGGQQQRVSVARALINGGEVILADEPTGALDSKSGADLLALLDDLHRKGHTVIIVTHDPAIAARMGRVIEIKDGRITADTRKVPLPARPRLALPATGRSGVGAVLDRLREALRMAVRAMIAHKLRSILTMLGIVIGIASVVSMVALGTGSQKRVLENIAAIGTSTIEIRKGTGFGDRRAGAITTLVPGDAVALSRQPYAVSVSPEVSTAVPVTRGAVTLSVQVRG
ncbi:MAG: ATP-binding cassette domain-containing protein, partial [Paracoccaceae bacterium]